MNVEQFIKQIAMNKDKEKYLTDLIKTSYIPYENKMARCEQIINISSYIEIDGHKVYRINTPVRFVLTSLTLINEYTDIDINFEDDSFLKDYNMLESQELVDEILKRIPTNEYKTWMTMLQMIDDDKHENERSLIAYLDTKFEAIERVLNATADALVEDNEANATE